MLRIESTWAVLQPTVSFELIFPFVPVEAAAAEGDCFQFYTEDFC